MFIGIKKYFEMLCVLGMRSRLMLIPELASGYVITFMYQVSSQSKQVEFYACAEGPMTIPTPDYLITSIYYRFQVIRSRFSSTMESNVRLMESIIRKSKYIAFVNMACPTRNVNNGGI